MLRNKVKEFRELHGLSREELGERIGVSRQTIHNIEMQPGYTPTAETMVALAKYFNCELGILFWIDREAQDKIAV